jgi:hypothetical protein
VVPGWNQRQLAEDIREGNNINLRLRGRQVQDLGFDLSSAGQPILLLSRAIS